MTVIKRRQYSLSLTEIITPLLIGLIGTTIIIQITLFIRSHEIHPQDQEKFFHQLHQSNHQLRSQREIPSSSSSSIESLMKKALGSDEISSLDKSRLPSIDEIHRLYGTQPHLYGLETCATFRSQIPKHQRLIAPAGAFNTGTNLLSSLLHRNCHIPSPLRDDPPGTREPGIRFQAPWGKHHPPSYRNNHVAKQLGAGVIQDHVLPVLMIKDPITWMSSMCSHPYDVRTTGAKCGTLVANGDTAKVIVPFAKETVTYGSMLDFWNEWNREWMEVSFPRLFVRYEDLIFNAEETVRTVCDCAGGEMKSDKFQYREDSAKGEGGAHKGGNGFVQAVIKYGNETLRDSILSRSADRLYFSRAVDKDMLNIFGYRELGYAEVDEEP